MVKDDFAMYGDYVANEVRKLRPRTQLLVKHQINELLYRAALQDLDIEDGINKLSDWPVPQEIETSMSSQISQPDGLQNVEDSSVMQGQFSDIAVLNPEYEAAGRDELVLSDEVQDMYSEDVINSLIDQPASREIETTVSSQITQPKIVEVAEDNPMIEHNGQIFEVVAVLNPEYDRTETDDTGLVSQVTKRLGEFLVMK